MAISQALAKDVLEKIFGAVDFTPPDNWYFGLSMSPIPDTGILPTNAEPVTGIGYERLQIPNTQFNGSNNGSFTTGDTSSDYPVGFVTNANILQLDEISGGSDFVVSHFFLSDSPQNSNVSGASRQVTVWGAFDRPKTLTVDSTLIIEPGGAIFEIINADV